jgi:hypothetical protein
MATETQPQDHILVRTIQNVVNGSADTKTLERVVKESQASFQEFVNGFQHTMGELPEASRTACEDLIEGSEDLFRQFESGLAAALEATRTKDQEVLMSVGNLFQRVTEQINAVQLELRNRCLVVMGPTTIPNLNQILKYYENYKAGKDQDGQLLELVEGEIFSCTSSLAALEQGKKTDAIEYMKQAYKAHQDCMQTLGKAIVANEAKAVERQIEACKTTFEEILARMGPAAASLRLEGPTQSADVNMILSVADDVRMGALPAQALLDPLNLYRTDAVSIKEQLIKMSTQPANSVLVTEEIERALEALELQEDAFEDYDLFFEHRDVILLERANQRLQRGAEALYLGYEQLQLLADREGKALCIKCSHYNPQSRNRCEKCGAPIVSMSRDQSTSTFETAEGQPQAAEASEPVLTPNMIRLYKAVDGVYEGTITKDEFVAEIAWFEKLLSSNQEYDVDEPDVSKMNAEQRVEAEAAIKMLNEVEDAFNLAHEELSGACSMFRRYLDTDDKADLEEGVKLADLGARKLAAVKAVAVQT